MRIPTLLALFCLAPLPAQEETAESPARLDLVVLKGGEVLEGTIRTLLDGYVELELEAGSTVGFSMAQVEEVRRGGGRPIGEAAVTAAIEPRDEWFVLHDAEGTAVGWMHSSVTKGEGSDLRLAEEWEFRNGATITAVTRLEVVDEKRNPKSCYYRERTWRENERHLSDERIIEARLVGDEVRVKRLTPSGYEETAYARIEDLRFPLLAREEMCIGMLPAEGEDEARVTLFDPGTEEFVERTIHAPRVRKVRWEGRPRQVIEVAAVGAGGPNTEWLDASQRVLRREINGPALVALPADPEAARRYASRGEAVFEGSVKAEANKRFAMLLPNPSWKFDEEVAEGQVIARSDFHNARASLVLLEHLDPDITLETAAEAVQRWQALLHPGFRLESRTPVRLAIGPAVRLEGEVRRDGSAFRSVVHVLEHRGAFLALTTMAPTQHWDELRADFEDILERLELDPEGVEPKAQGPLVRDG